MRFYYFVLWPTKSQLQLIYKLSHSYMFWHYSVILRELIISTSPSYTSNSNAAVSHNKKKKMPVSAEEEGQLLPDRNMCTCSKIMTQNKKQETLWFNIYIYIYILKYQLVNLPEEDQPGAHSLEVRLNKKLQHYSTLKYHFILAYSM